MKNRGI